jgi:hypothetical protein
LVVNIEQGELKTGAIVLGKPIYIIPVDEIPLVILMLKV